MASYIDDLGLYATTFEEYLQRLQTMLERLDSYDIRLNGGKCQFGQRSMEFLGHRVSEQGVEHTPERIEAIKNMTEHDCAADQDAASVISRNAQLF